MESVLFLLVCSGFVLAVPSPQETYKGHFDDINIDEALENERLYRTYFSCFIGEGKCTPDGKEVKGRTS